jgi:hypothetical protein
VPKGTACGDLDNDGWMDIVVSNLKGENNLYHNNGDGTFTDIARQAGIQLPLRSFPAWIWDYDNDGNLDVFISAYSLAPGDLVRKALGHAPHRDVSGHYRGNGKNSFENRAVADGFDTSMLTMGCNFGDLNNDGYPDLYLGTGSPDVSILLPNFVYLNKAGRGFTDVTMASGMGHLQKGHAIAMADFDKDGDLDVFAQMGGARRIDHFRDSLYQNPGFPGGWIALKLTGTTSNRSAIGARIRITLAEGGTTRQIHRMVGSGASFGASPLQQQIGIGSATTIQSIEVTWPKTGLTQKFENPGINQRYGITEGRAELDRI